MGVRLACDYRYLNQYTVGDAYPMATIDEVLRSVGRGRYISTFDAKSGYWQIRVAEEDRWLTAFVTHDGLYEWSECRLDSRTLELPSSEPSDPFCVPLTLLLIRVLTIWV